MKMTISKKLFGGFLAVLVVLIATVAISYYQISTVDHTYTELINDKSKKLILIQEMKVSIQQEQTGVRGFLIDADPVSLQTFTQAHDDYLEISKVLNEIIVLPTAKELLQQVDQLENQYYQFASQEIQLKQQNKNGEILSLIDTGREMTQKFSQKIDDFADFQQNVLDEGSKDTSDKVTSVKYWVVTLGIIAILIGVAIALYSGRVISQPIVAIAKAAEKIASGDLTVEDITVKNKDEIGELAGSFNQMSRNLRHLIHQVGSNTEMVAASAEELTASAEQTSSATEQIAVTIQNVAADVEKEFKNVDEATKAIHEMSIGVQQVATNAQIVSDVALNAHEKASEGNQSIRTAVEQMGSINRTVGSMAAVIKKLDERSNEIGQMIETITEIANQTNLLALNAAIEAARAGEHGRGFAVVASEVRKLAEKSALSAQQISHLVSAIQGETDSAAESMQAAAKEVAAGIKVVNSAGESFYQIQESVNEVNKQIHEVSSSVQQMAAGAEQMVQSMNFISTVAETTAASTQEVAGSAQEQLASMEEIAASANALSKMSEDLQLYIEKFKV